MPRIASRANICLAALLFLAAGFAAIAAAQQNRPPSSGARARVLLQPRFTPGQILRYRMTITSESSTRRSGVVKDPQGPVVLDVTWDAAIRLETSAVQDSSGTAPAPASRQSAPAPVRLRIIYESSHATLRSDTPEPRADEIQRQYAQLAGRSLEFTLAPGGQVSDIRGLEGFLTDERSRAAVQQWIAQLSAASAAPSGGITPGQKWNTTQPADLPLAGLSWRTDFTYLRNEPCRLASPAATAGGAADSQQPDRADCAVILSRLALITTRPMRDPTPDDYRRNNLRTSGQWTGTGQNLMYVSLDTGWIVSSTQESTQHMDVSITDASPNPAGAVRHAGSVTTRSQISLLDEGVLAPEISPPTKN